MILLTLYSLCFISLFLYVYFDEISQQWTNRRRSKEKPENTRRPGLKGGGGNKMDLNDIPASACNRKVFPWVHFEPKPAQPQQPKRLNVTDRQVLSLHIGINYILTSRALQGCINDALNFKSMLLANGVPETQTTLLTDFTDVKPTKAQILRHLEVIANRLPVDMGTFLISFSGHGTRAGVNNETICALADDGRGVETILDTEIFSRLIPILETKGRSQTIFVSDSCFSERVMKLKYTYSPNLLNTDIWSKVNNTALPTTANVIVISGSTRTQPSTDVQTSIGINYGALTWAILKTLQRYQNQVLTYKAFILAVNRELRASGYQQISCFSSSVPLDLTKEFYFI